MTEQYNLLEEQLKKFADINYASGVLQWDQEVYMPQNGAEIRAQQLATLAGLAHETGTSKVMSDLLNDLSNSKGLNDKQQRNVKEALRNFTDRTKYSTDFVMEMSKTVSE